MPTASATSPITPPSASISRTRCPLAIPPMAGLHDICAIRSAFIVIMTVRRPMRAQARAASHPAWPPPTMTMSCEDSIDNIVTVKVLVIGGGGREHALRWRLAKCPSVSEVLSATSDYVQFVEENGVGLTVVGPETPLDRKSTR